MTDHSDFLTEAEKQHLSVGIDGVRRAQILAGVAELAELIGEPGRVGEVVDTARERLEGVSTKQLVKIGKHIVGVTSLLQHSAPSEAPRSGQHEVVTANQSVEEAGVIEESHEALIDELETLISTGGVRFLKKGLGEEWWQELGLSSAHEATPAAVAEVMVRNARIRRPTTIEQLQQILESYLTGDSMVTLGERYAKEPSGIFAKLCRVRDERKWQSVQLKTIPTTAASTQVASETADTAENLPSHSELIELWSEKLGFTEEERLSFESLLDIQGDVDPTDEQISAIKTFVEYVTQRHESIDNRKFALSDTHKGLLRQLTGAWYRQTTNRPLLTTPKTLAQIQAKVSNPTVRQRAVVLVDEALHKILTVDSAGTHEEASDFLEKKASISHRSRNNQEILDTALYAPNAVVDSVWREVAHEEYTKSAPNLFTEEEARELWTRLHFDDEGNYSADMTPTQRAALKKLQQRFFEVGKIRLIDKQTQSTAIRVLCNMSQGVNTLDDVYETLQKQNPDFAKELTQRFVVDGVSELLR